MREVVAYKRLKTGKLLNRQPRKVVVVAYRRWSFTRGSNCKALTEKILVFWIWVVAYNLRGGCSWRLVSYQGAES